MSPQLQVEPTNDWHQIVLRTREPGQRTYAHFRPVVLFGQSPAERATESGLSERTIFRQVGQFEQLGMASFVPPAAQDCAV